MTIEGFLDLVKRRHELQHTLPPAPAANGPGSGGESPDTVYRRNECVLNYNPLFGRPFCFILGAGASVSSGIKGGADLAWQWLQEMHLREDNDRNPLGKWATPEHLGEDNFEEFTLGRYAEFYPQLFERYFRGNAEYANAYLQDIMRGAIPGFGYSILAWILARTRHHVVITTNFDNLVSDSLFQYARVSPLVIGHESLARFVRLEPGRPLVCKIHRDLLFDPMNDVDSVGYLKTEWAEALHTLLKRYTPIVIGYGGNDGSLMSFLEHMPTLGPDGLFWTYWNRDPQLPKRVEKVVRKHQGWLVPIYGFDELMAQFAEIFGVPNLGKEMAESAQKTIESYKNEIRAFIDKAVLGLASEAIGTERKRLYRAAIYHSELSDLKNHWHYWEIKARAAETDDEQEEVYETAIQKVKDSAGLLANFAWFLWQKRQQNSRAEEYYKRAIETDAMDFDAVEGYVRFLVEVRSDLDGAAAVYDRGIAADCKNAIKLGQNASFLESVKKDFKRAEDLYKRAIEADPNHALNLGNYAHFLEVIKEDFEGAEDLYKRAIKADRKNAYYLGTYARFLEFVRKDADGAEDYYKRAIGADPNNAFNLGNFARFLARRRNDPNTAVEIAKKARDISPNDESLRQLVQEIQEQQQKNGSEETLKSVHRVAKRPTTEGKVASKVVRKNRGRARENQ